MQTVPRSAPAQAIHSFGLLNCRIHAPVLVVHRHDYHSLIYWKSAAGFVCIETKLHALGEGGYYQVQDLFR
ncbi:MAG TPA: hypothetical protein VIT91_00810 [Chthoniobacterales bacterium]